MDTVLRTAISLFLAGSVTACGCVASSAHESAPRCQRGCADVCANRYFHEAYDDGYCLIKYESDQYHYRPYHPGCYYHPYFYHVPYSDYYRY